MGLRYPNEFRMEIIKEIYAEEMSICKISEIYKISRGTLYTVKHKINQTVD
jgi:transposase-like protein